MPAAPAVTIFGLGLMGRPMARRLIERGIDTRGWNRSVLASDLVRGIPLVSSVEEAGRSEVCLLILVDSNATDSVLAQMEPRLRRGQVVLDMGSSDPARSREHAPRLAARGIGWVDAPVSGGPEGCAAGTLAIMAGGADEHVAQVRPILDALGANVVHVGGPGAGHTTKVINQLIVGLTIEAVAEALILAERCGIDPRMIQQALRGGFADSKILHLQGTRMIKRTYELGGRARVQLKDLRLALGLAAGAGIRLPHLESTAARYEALVAQGDGDLDHSALHKLLDVGRSRNVESVSIDDT
jgi:3-hydroxyisobutyrate dehydrogenase-like beta-hydroxyacid dehydrogenase